MKVPGPVNSITFHIKNMCFQAKPRPRAQVVQKSGKRPYAHIYTPMSYLKYEDAVSSEIQSQYDGEIHDGPFSIEMVFYRPMPQSWSKVKQQRKEFTMHDSKPDGDNLGKGILDAMEGIIFKNDSKCFDTRIVKLWSLQEELCIRVNFFEVIK